MDKFRYQVQPSNPGLIPENSNESQDTLRSPDFTTRYAGPDFLGIGAEKAGTTWLYEQLKRHPDISFPAEKEVHFWDKREGRPVNEWLDLFSGAAPRKRGEITPAYAILSTDTIREIHTVCPDLRLFYSIRNPIDRAWSSALMELDLANMTFDEVSETWFIDQFKSSRSLLRGDAEACLLHWRSIFPAEQMHVILYDDLALNPLDTLVQLAAHIGVDGEFFHSIPENELRERVFAGPGLLLPPSFRRFLAALYGRKIERLQGILGRDLGHWLAA